MTDLPVTEPQLFNLEEPTPAHPNPAGIRRVAVLTSGADHVTDALRHAGWGFWGAVLFMGLANTVLGFSVWATLIREHGAARVAPLSLLVPVFGLIGGDFVAAFATAHGAHLASITKLSGVLGSICDALGGSLIEFVGGVHRELLGARPRPVALAAA